MNPCIPLTAKALKITNNGRPHTDPLSPTAAALGNAGWSARKYESVYAYVVARSIGWRPHDLRRTAATRMREVGVSSEAIEAVLNHSPDRLLRTYHSPACMPAMRDALVRLDTAIAEVLALRTPTPPV